MPKHLKRYSAWLAAAIFLACACIGCRSVSAAEAAGSVPATDPRLAMITALEANGPHPWLLILLPRIRRQGDDLGHRSQPQGDFLRAGQA